MYRSLVLIQLDVDKQFTLHVDASAYGMGAVLLQEGNHTTKTLAQCHKPILHPVMYYSATFTPTEQNYNIYERELLAIMKALAHWRHYLGWTKTPLYYLHRPCQPPVLETSQEPEPLNSQVAHRPPRIQLYLRIHPQEDQYCCRYPIPTTWERSQRRRQQRCHHHSPTPSSSCQNPRGANNSA